jgi:hypothetical protein
MRDAIQVVGVYIVTDDPQMRGALQANALRWKQAEEALGFDPVHHPEDAKALRALVD